MPVFGPRIVDARWSAAGPGILVVFRGRRPAAWRRETASKRGSYFETGPKFKRAKEIVREHLADGHRHPVEPIRPPACGEPATAGPPEPRCSAVSGAWARRVSNLGETLPAAAVDRQHLPADHLDQPRTVVGAHVVLGASDEVSKRVKATLLFLARAGASV